MQPPFGVTSAEVARNCLHIHIYIYIYASITSLTNPLRQVLLINPAISYPFIRIICKGFACPMLGKQSNIYSQMVVQKGDGFPWYNPQRKHQKNKSIQIQEWQTKHP